MLNTSRSANARAFRHVAGAGLLAVVYGCNTDKTVSVTDPNNLTPQAANSAGTTPALVQGAIFQFQGGYSGFGDDAYLSSSAVITDEFYYGDTFTTRASADKRSLQPPALGNVSDAAFGRLETARVQARRAFAQVLRFSTPKTAAADSVTAAQMRAIEGYVYVTMSEGWCGAVPFSLVPDTGTIDPTKLAYAAPIGTRAMNDSALARFGEALQYDPTNMLAMVGKARALLNEGRFTEAATAAAAVPTTYVYLLQHSANSGSENNPIAALQQNGRYGISNLEGATTTDSTGAVRSVSPAVDSVLSNPTAQGLPYRAIHDPRVPFEPNGSSGSCFVGSIACWVNDNYPSYASDVPLASGVEARLIQAEALYQGGQYGAMLDSLNALRARILPLVAVLYPQQKQTFATATIAALPATAAADANSARTALFTERSYWLFNTGHRQGDLRRLARAPYSLPTNQVFPSGPFFRGGKYGDDVAFPVPFSEANNPNYSAAACSTTTP